MFAVILAWFVVAAVLAFLASDVTYLSYFFRSLSLLKMSVMTVVTDRLTDD